jgi:hypothetical protein
MKGKIILLAGLILLSFNSCTRLLFGLNPSKVETKESVIAGAYKLGIDTTNLYYFNRDTSYAKLHGSQLMWNKYSLLNKHMVLMINPIRCHTGLFNLMLDADQHTLDSLNNVMPSANMPERKLPHPRMLPLTGTLEQIKEDVNSENYDFYLIYWWTNAMHRFTKRDMGSIQSMKEDPRYTVRVYYLNIDLLDIWYENPDVAGEKIRVKPILER